MAYVGNTPSKVPLTSADITDSIITSAKITDATIANADIANTTIALAKLSATGTASASTFLRGDNSWASAGATAGQVIQVLGATDSTTRSTTSASFVTGSNTLSVTITPSSASNKIFIIASLGALQGDNINTTIYRASTNLGGTRGFFVGDVVTASMGFTMSYLDSPATTSATTYQVYFKVSDAGTTGIYGAGTVTSTITCFEIKG